MIKPITVTVELDTGAPERKRVTEFKVKTKDFEFVAESVPFSISDASRMFELALAVVNHDEKE